MSKNQKLELTWVGKDVRPKLEPRILIEDPEKSYHAEHHVSENDIFHNMLILGDNLLALKALEQEFAGKIKCIYIDPPYNTGSAFSHYDDGVEHSLWLSLMQRRIELRHRLLQDEGKEIWPEKQWQWSRERAEEAQRNNELVITKKKGRYTVSYKQYLRDEEGEERRGKPKSVIEGAYTQHGTYESVALFGAQGKFSFPKPERLIWELIESCTEPGEWVLDSFLGSGTTAAVAHKMGRRWIGIELGEHCHTHCIPRLKKVIDGEDPGGITKAVDWKGGGGFRYYRLGPSLIVEDDWGNPVINSEFNAAMLAEAMCKLEGFEYAPSEDVYWIHGKSTETDFLYVTTQFMSKEMLTRLSDEVGSERSLLICCSAFRCDPGQFPNLTIKKIPKAVLKKCEWGHDDYSLEIKNLPKAPPEPEKRDEDVPAKPRRKFGKGSPGQESLFDSEDGQ